MLRILPALLVIGLVWILAHPIGALPAIGTVIDPVNGLMAAAEPVDKDFNANLKLTGVQAPVEVWFEDRLVPHVRAQNDHDLYFTQGYIHAYFRLWQMDMQTRAAGGRVAEVAGEKALEFDRGQRRKGMVYGAEASLKAMEADPRTRDMLNAYRDGINTYIATLNFRELPIEYKLMGFVPEQWTNLRSALLLKYMADDLTGKTDDIAFTLLRDQLGQEEFDYLFPERISGSKPVIPEGTKFDPPSLKTPAVPEGDVWAHFDKSPEGVRAPSRPPPKGEEVLGKHIPCKIPRKTEPFPTCHLSPSGEGRDGGFPEQQDVAATASRIESDAPFSKNASTEREASPFLPFSNGSEDPDVAVGSNNWAISGAHTASGKPILCNDPHLGLNLPSLWFEMQLTAPGINTYGVSLPGAPGVVIGYNDKISWGFTNNYRDVKDFYKLQEFDSRLDENIYPASGPPPPGRRYIFTGSIRPFDRRIEMIAVKGKAPFVDTVLYTVHGPVMYDPSFPDPAKTGALLACTWMAHRGTNELLALYLVNRAQNYDAFTAAIQHFECPAQNFAYADVAGNIAMWGQGQFINKWKGQGKYVMNGSDSSTLWGENIPMAENPHVLNPPQGYVASANQQVTDSTYPYWYNGNFTEWRSWEIHSQLSGNPDADLSRDVVKDGIIVQSADVSSLAKSDFSSSEMMRMQNNTQSLLQRRIEPMIAEADLAFGQKLFTPINDSFRSDSPWDLPPQSTSATYYQIFWTRVNFLLWNVPFTNNGYRMPLSERTMAILRGADTSFISLARRNEIIVQAAQNAADSVRKLQRSTGAQWYQVKNTSLTHLAKLPAFSYDHLKIGGWGNTINAVSGNHGPSWRMIVEMDSVPKAFAIYPGGQSGNPGSIHYGDNVQQWVDGRYNTLQFLTGNVKTNPFKYNWTISG